MNRNGQYPSIAMNNEGWIIQVYHKETVVKLNLRYKIGFLHENRIIWSNHSGQNYGLFNEGYYPRISINDDGMIVAVFSHQVRRRLFYRLGRLTFGCRGQASLQNLIHSASIEWLQKEMPLSEGLNPAVSISKNNLVVIVYEKGFHTYYRIGHVDNNEIKWLQADKSGEDRRLIESSSSKHASVAINDKGQVAIGYSSWAERTLHYRAAEIKDGHTLVLDENKFTPPGANYQPVVSLNKHGYVVAVHHTLQGRRFLKVNYGVMKKDPVTGHLSISWSLDTPNNFAYDSYYASVVLSDTMKVVTAYKSLTLKIKASIRNCIGQLSF